MIRLAHLSDIHFGGENFAAVEETARFLQQESPDLVVITGDLTTFGRRDEFRRAAAWVEGLGLPTIVTPGNHDTPYLDLASRLLSPFARYERAFGPARGRDWANGEAMVTTVNTARGAQWRWNWSKGAIGAKQVSRALARMNARAAGTLAVLAVHHPLMEMIGGPMTARVRGGERAARRLCEAGVDLVLSGHIHAPFVWPLPWAQGAYAVGAGTLSLRERGVPAGFNLIEAEGASIAVTAKAWTGSRLETWRTWSVPRRSAAESPQARRLPSSRKARSVSPR